MDAQATRPSLDLRLVVVLLMVASLTSCTDTTAPNQVPTALAGPDMTVNVGERVHLSGAGSDPDKNSSLTYSWTLPVRPAGSNAVLSNAASANPSFTADVRGTFVARLIVSDGEASSAPDDCTITVNGLPVANAGPDQDVLLGSVLLDGTGSSDPDGDPLSYSWSFVTRPSGSNAYFSESTVPQPELLVDAEGVYVVELTVNDGRADSSPDQVTIRAQAMPTDGFYEGTTSQGKGIYFIVSFGYVYDLDLEIVVSCTLCNDLTFTLYSIEASIDPSSMSFAYSYPGLFEITGDATSPTTFSGTATFSPAPPPNCGSACATQDITWTAAWTGSRPFLGSAAVFDPDSGRKVLRIAPDGTCTDTAAVVEKGNESS